MKVLFAGLKNEYGDSKRGESFEYKNFFGTLEGMEGVSAEMFPFDEIMEKVGRDEMNRQLILKVKQDKPDLLFCFLFTEEIKKETIEYITEKTNTKTFNWFADDHWRFPIYSRFWASLFTAVSTTDSRAIAKYKSMGVNAIKTQWAANINFYKPQHANNSHNYSEIAFVGQNYGNRGKYIEYLKQRGLPVGGYGDGWVSGRMSQLEMLNIFSTSKVNLNFTESPYMTVAERFKIFAKLAIKKELGKYKFNAHHFWSNLQSAIGTQRRQIKGRTFEVPACGGFLLTGGADNLQDYYEDGKEIVIYKNKQDLAEKCKYYLEHEEERKVIAKAGHERTIKDHTYEQRFRNIFSAMGLM